MQSLRFCSNEDNVMSEQCWLKEWSTSTPVSWTATTATVRCAQPRKQYCCPATVMCRRTEALILCKITGPIPIPSVVLDRQQPTTYMQDAAFCLLLPVAVPGLHTKPRPGRSSTMNIDACMTHGFSFHFNFFYTLLCATNWQRTYQSAKQCLPHGNPATGGLLQSSRVHCTVIMQRCSREWWAGEQYRTNPCIMKLCIQDSNSDQSGRRRSCVGKSTSNEWIM